jgi:PAS domain S-box-containing protein
MSIPVPDRLAPYRDGLAEFRFAATIADVDQPDCPIIWANERFFDLTGYPPAEVIGRNCRFLQPGPPCPHARVSIRSAIATASSTDVLLQNARRDGTRFINHLLIRPLAPETRLVVGAQHDVSANVMLNTGADGPTYQFVTDPPDIADRLQAHRAGILARWVRLLNESAAPVR